jgi:hypothetical protein
MWNGQENKVCEYGETFSQSGFKGDSGDWAVQVREKLDGG